MMFQKTYLAAAAFCCLGFGAPAGATTPDNFVLHNAGDLVSVCTAAPSDPLYTGAVNFCQGFVVGVVSSLGELAKGHTQQGLFCLPSPMPTRTETITSYVQWASAKEERLNMPTTDSVAQFLAERYPCH
jgi:hypothetical protein